MNENEMSDIGGADIPDGELVKRLLAVSKSLRMVIALKLAGMQLQFGSDDILLALQENVLVTISGLVERMQVRPAIILRAIETLVYRGLVTSTGDQIDTLRTIISITAAGIEARSGVLDMWSEIETSLTARMSRADAVILRSSLASLEARLQGQLSRVGNA